MTSAMPARGGSNAALPARKWPSGQVTASKCSYPDLRALHRRRRRAAARGRKTSLASPEPRDRVPGSVISGTELGRCRKSHSAYIPGTPTSGGFRRRMAAHPFD